MSIDLDAICKLEDASRALEPDAAGRAKLHKQVRAYTERFLRQVETLPGYVETERPGAGLLAAPIGERGRPLEEILDLLEREVDRPGGNPASPGHLAYVPGGGIYQAALADFLAAVVNKYAAIEFTGPGPVRMENQVLRWAADLVGLPASAGGNISSGGSIATLTAITAAREAHRLRSADVGSAVVYLTSQAHHCIEKALRIAGMAEATIRFVPMDSHYRMQPGALAEGIAADRARGLRPWLVVAVAGSTDVGAVDPLAEIAEIAAAGGCWLHVDAAYGGFFLLTDHGRAVLSGIERADSVILDPHKGLFLPWGAGIVLVRDIGWLRAAHGHGGAPTALGSYLQDTRTGATDVDDDVWSRESPADVSPELTKPFRALRIWLPLLLAGVAPFRAALDEKLLLARYVHHELAALGFEVGPEPELSIATFRWVAPDVDLAAANGRNRRILDGVRRDGRIFLSSTTLDGRFMLRLAVLSMRTHRRHIDLALRVLREQMAATDDAATQSACSEGDSIAQLRQTRRLSCAEAVGLRTECAKT